MSMCSNTLCEAGPSSACWSAARSRWRWRSDTSLLSATRRRRIRRNLCHHWFGGAAGGLGGAGDARSRMICLSWAFSSSDRPRAP